MKIIKPDHQALLTRTLRWQDRDLLSVGLVALFDLQAPGLQTLRTEVDLWQLWPQAPGTPAVLDEGYPKPRAEFMVYGEACAPQGQAVTQLVVSAQVGEVRKSLQVHGERRWSALGLAGAAQPFTRVPVVPARAFGGPGSALNPLGVGLDQVFLPQVEDARQAVASPSDRPEPAGFWGVDASAPRRQQALGAMNAAWLRTQWPALPKDTQDEFFQSAPPTQRGAAQWRGDEPIALLNWDSANPALDSRLPGLRARCFALRKTAQGESVFEEMPAHAETVWLLPGLGCGAVLYRATLKLNDPDALDVTHLVSDWEDMNSAPLGVPEYRARIQDAAAQAAAAQAPADAAAASAANAAAAAPVAEAAEKAESALPAMAGALGTAAAAVSAVAAVAKAVPTHTKPASPLQALVDKVLVGQPLTEADLKALASAPPEEAPEFGDAHIEAMTQQMLAQRDALLAEHGLSEADVAAFLKERGASAEAIRVAGMTRAQMQAQFATPTEPAASVLSAPRTAPVVSSVQPIIDKVLAGQELTETDLRVLASAAPDDAPVVSDAHVQAMTERMLSQRDALLAEHGLKESDVAAFLKSRGASAQAIHVGSMSRAELEAHVNAPVAGATVVGAAPSVPSTATLPAAVPAVSPLQAVVDKVLLGQSLTDADLRALSSAAPQDAPNVSDAHVQAMTRQMLDQRDALLAEHGIKEADVSAFLKERGASAEAIHVGGMTRAEMDAQFGLSAAAALAQVAAPVAAPAAPAAPVAPPADRAPNAGVASAAPVAAVASIAPAVAAAPSAKHAVPGALSAIGTLGSAAANMAAPAAAAVSAPVAEAAPIAAAASAAAAPPPLPAAAVEPKVWTREAVIEHHAQAGSFKGEDLSKLDLSELDLSGADFSEAMLEATSFRNSQLAAARFDGAQLPKADLSGIDAPMASFSKARAASAVFAGAKLAGAVLDAADFHEADFAQALLEGASCARTDFQQAQMTGLRAAGARAPQALFDGCELAGADFAKAALEGARFNGASVSDADFSSVQGARSEWFGAQASRANFSTAQLGQARGGADTLFADANFEGANLNGAVWDGATLQGASMRRASLVGADFSGAQAAGLRLDGADARGLNLSRAQLAGLQAAQANLMGASLRRADLPQARMAGSNLHGSDLESARMDGSDLRGALTAATVLSIDGRPEKRGVLA